MAKLAIEQLELDEKTFLAETRAAYRETYARLEAQYAKEEALAEEAKREEEAEQCE